MKKLFFLILLLLSFSAALYGEEFPVIKGWAASGDIIIYRPANLWKYIDGAADQFLSYDFKVLRLREFRKNDVIITVDIYDMGSPINAFGIYSTERPNDTEFLSIGTESVVIPPYSAMMLKDRFYVKVMIQQGELNQKDGEDILKDVAVSLPGETNLPAGLKLLPEENRVPGTIKYVTRGYLGLSELNNIASADYKDTNGNEFRSFVMILPDKRKVDEIWNNLSGKWQKETQSGRIVLYREVPYEGFIGALMTNGMITGVSGIEKKTELFKILIGR